MKRSLRPPGSVPARVCAPAAPSRSQTLAGTAAVSFATAFATALAITMTVSMATPRDALASPDTLRVAIEDIVFGAVDVVAAPVTGGVATARNLDAVSDNGFLQGLYAVPGWLGLTGLQFAQGSLRIVTGAIQLVPGIVLFPFEADVPEDFNVFRSGEKLVDLRNPLAENPAWLRYVPPVTPFTIDCRMAPISPWAVYVSPNDETAGDTGSLAGSPRATPLEPEPSSWSP